ncbi:MAG: glycosyltransferase family 4 protein [Chloroflexota bacterium]
MLGLCAVRIAIVRKRYTFHGGAEGFSDTFMRHLVEAGHSVHLYAMTWDGAPSSPQIHAHRVPAWTFNSMVRDLSFALSSYIMLKKDRFDIIQSHDKTLYQDIYRAGDGCHIEWLKQRWKRSGLLGRLSMLMNPYHWCILALESVIFRTHRFRKVIAISKLVRKNILDNYRVPEADIAVIYNGVDLQRFHPRLKTARRSEIRERYSIPEDSCVVLFVGSGFERKGVRYLIEAAELLETPLTVLIVGRGPIRRYKDIAMRQRVIFCGPQREVEAYYGAADVFVFPALYEPFGNVHLEALASGLPVITTRLCGASEIIEEGRQGFVVDVPEDVAALADRIARVVARDERERMSRQARLLAEQFSFDRHIRESLRLYDSLSG